MSAGSALRNPTHWRLFAILVLPVLLLGLQHHVRFLLEYGTLSPSLLVTPDEGAILGRWSQSVYARTHLDMLWYLVAVFPLLLIFAFPQVYARFGRLLRERRWEFVYVAVVFYLFGVLFAFQHNEMRYLAPAMPFLYVSIAVIWHVGDRTLKRRMLYLLVISFVTMITTGYLNTIAWPKRTHHWQLETDRTVTLCVVEEPRRPQRSATSTARMDSQDRPETLAGLSPQRRAPLRVRRQGTRRERRPRPLAVMGTAITTRIVHPPRKEGHETSRRDRCEP